ncbi:hypothetical protein DL95DRAFT_318816, partial [Leptodontidium sp. 2 PMI_412]
QIFSAPASSTLSVTGCTSTPPAPTNPGTPADCCRYYVVQSGDTCSIIASRFGTTVAEFEALNPDINLGCTNLNPDLALVVSSYLSASSASCMPTPASTRPGQAAQCCQFYRILPDQDCNLVAAINGITVEYFQSLNPEIDSTCSNLFLGYEYVP